MIDHLSLYRLPWNAADNGISWLEPTTLCNLRCAGCYRDLEAPAHLSLEAVRADLETFRALRRSDCMSIAGGDPLVYPRIVELVAMIRELGWKPIVNTNGLALTEELLAELKGAGAYGFTFHVDTSQGRPGVAATAETELNDLRRHYAGMLARAGGLACAFNATVSERTVDDIPALVRWAGEHADKVQTMVFILYRSPRLTGDFDFYARGRKIAMDGTYREAAWGGEKVLHAADVVAKIREADPLYAPAAYLNGTADPRSLKWLLATRIVQDGETVGYLSPRLMEVIQSGAHLLSGSYLAYASPRSTAQGKLAALGGALIDRSMRPTLRNLLRRLAARPAALRRPAYLQSLMIIQPVNFTVDGRQDMCDSCPDMTLHEGKLVWSCRLEELRRYGAFVETVPRGEG